MSHLFQALAERVNAWRASRYDCPGFPAIGAMLGPMLTAIHNLHDDLNLMREVREALDAGSLRVVQNGVMVELLG